MKAVKHIKAENLYLIENAATKKVFIANDIKGIKRLCNHEYENEDAFLQVYLYGKNKGVCQMCDKQTTNDTVLFQSQLSQKMSNFTEKTPKISTIISKDEYFNMTASRLPLLFEKFYEENSKKIELKKTYPLLHENLLAWIEQLEQWDVGEKVVQFAKFFSRHLKHVSFPEYRDALGRAALDAIEMVKQLQTKHVILLIEGEVIKSNTWVTTLIWPILKRHVTHIIDNPFQIPKSFTNRNDVVVLIPDDMAYSGKQLNWSLDILHRAAIHTIPILAFISHTAVKKFETYKNHLTFPKSITVVENVSVLMQKADLDPQTFFTDNNGGLWEHPWHRCLGKQRGEHTLIYFDHKLADSVSVPSRLITEQIAYNKKTGEMKMFRSIKGCENIDYSTEHWKLASESNVNPDFNYTNACPKAYYKTISYTINGELLIDQDKKQSIVNLMIEKY
jgi:hypothetical protein